MHIITYSQNNLLLYITIVIYTYIINFKLLILMKKLCKLTLEQLEKEMPVLSEAEQKNMIGGTVFYDYSGNYMGTCGPNDNIRFIRDSLSIDEVYHAINQDHIGIGFSDLDNTSKEAFMAKFAYEYGFHFASYHASSNFGYEMGYNLKTGELLISTSGGDSYKTVSSLISTLTHETLHKSNGSDEKQTISDQVNSASYLNTNIEYRIQTAKYYMLVTGCSQSVAYTECKVYGPYN